MWARQGPSMPISEVRTTLLIAGCPSGSVKVFEACRDGVQEPIALSCIDYAIAFSSTKVQTHKPRVIIRHHEGLRMVPIDTSKFQSSRQLHRPLIRQSLRDPGS